MKIDRNKSKTKFDISYGAKTTNMSCCGKLKSGHACTYKAKKDGYCLIHWFKEEECPVCYELIKKDNEVTLSCNHKYHLKCIKPWLKKNYPGTCPTCRAVVDDNTLAKLNIKVPKVIVVLKKLEEYMFDAVHSHEDVDVRIERMVTVVSHSLQHEVSIRKNIVEFLIRRMKNQNAEINSLRNEIKKIQRIRKSVHTVDISNQDASANVLEKAFDMLVKLYIWDPSI